MARFSTGPQIYLPLNPEVQKGKVALSRVLYILREEPNTPTEPTNAFTVPVTTTQDLQICISESRKGLKGWLVCPEC